MPLENLTVGRVCLHEVHQRADDRTIVTPTFASGLLNLEPRARSAFTSRVLAAFRSGAKCMDMSIMRFEPGSIVERGAAIVNVSDALFVQQSRAFAELLAEAQTSRGYPGGIVVVFDGTVGHPSTRFFGVMKAELHEGFLKQNDMQATFVDSLFLSPKTKLYKIGIFIGSNNRQQALPAGWSATVYDNQLSATQRDGAALYFHEAFLGLTIPENSAHQTRQFFEKTREFIAAAPLADEQKVDLYNSLYTYLKVDQSPTVQIGHFADTYMSDDLGIVYRAHMRQERFPDRAIPKDLSEVGGRLRIRRLRFSRQITLSGPSEAINELVEVEAIDSPEGDAWTRITVRGKLESQE